MLASVAGMEDVDSMPREWGEVRNTSILRRSLSAASLPVNCREEKVKNIQFYNYCVNKEIATRLM